MKTALAPLLVTALSFAVVAPAAAQAQDVDSLYRAGATAFQQQRVFEAIEILGRVAAADPGYRDVQLLLGQSYLVAGLHRAAKQHFERAFEADPSNGLAAFLLGLSLHQAARYYEAAEVLAQAHALAPENPHPLIYRSLALLKLGRLDEARSEIDSALAIAPREATARAAAAEVELAQGQFDRAGERLETLLREAPENVEYRLLYARTLYEGGRPSDAVPVLRQLADAPPPRSDVLYLLAQALLRSGDTEAGRAALARFKEQKAVEERMRVLEAKVSTEPDDAEARLEFVRLLLDHGLRNAAVPHLAVLQKALPGDPRVRQLGLELGRRPGG
jgi:predicted Zn-dependent protease